jgi:hypothetical protein
LFTSVSFAVNHDPASSLFADEFQESKTNSSQSVDVQDNNFFDFSWIDLDQKGYINTFFLKLSPLPISLMIVFPE